MNLKPKTHLACQKILLEKRIQLVKAVEDVQKSLSSESKSTAGDKHETGRAMLQLEREKLGQQLQQLQQDELLLSKIAHTTTHESCVLGSLVRTHLGNYYLGISLGQITVAEEKVFSISLQSPIGKLLFGKKVNDTLTFNGKEIQILEIM